MARTWLTESPIDVGAVLRAVEWPGAGAAVVFAGTVRDENLGRSVAGMRYEAYPAMAEQVLAAIVAEAETRWSGAVVAAVHRTGDLAVGEASVVIAVASAHRAQAYEVSRYVIEAIKERLPVWKKERYDDGTEAWLDGAAPPGPEQARV